LGRYKAKECMHNILIVLVITSFQCVATSETEYCRSIPDKSDMFLGDISRDSKLTLILNNPTCVMFPTVDYKSIYISSVTLIDPKSKLKGKSYKQVLVKGKSHFIKLNDNSFNIKLTVKEVEMLYNKPLILAR
jgi:hypothetical protein